MESTLEPENQISLNRLEIGPIELNRLFSESEYGKKLGSGTRFGFFKPQATTNEEWEKILGVDVNNLKHLRLSYGLARAFTKYSENLPESWVGEIPEDARFNDEERADLELAAIIHDWGESITGDITYDHKSLEDSEKESEAFKEILTQVFADRLTPELTRKIEHLLSDVILPKEHNSKLSRAFNAIERAGYFRTAIRSWKEADKKEEDMEFALKLLTINVVANQLKILMEYSAIYPALRLQLEENAGLITKILSDGLNYLTAGSDKLGRKISEAEWTRLKNRWEKSEYFEYFDKKN